MAVPRFLRLESRPAACQYVRMDSQEDPGRADLKRRPAEHMDVPAVSARRVTLKVSPDIRALDRVNLSIPRGALSAVAGPKDSGKTCLLRVLAGLQPATSGEIAVLGMNPGDHPAQLRRRVVFAPRKTALDPDMTGNEILNLWGTLYRLSAEQRRLEIGRVASGMGLTTHLGRTVSSYPGTLRRRLHLALAFLPASDLLLLDEPGSGLDAQGRRMLWELMQQRSAAGLTSIIATHDLAAVEANCDQVLILEGGRVAADGSPEELRRRFSNTRLAVQLAAPPPNRPLLERNLTELPGVEVVRSFRREIHLEATSTGVVRVAVLEALNRLELEVAALKTYRPDLEGAFITLTGKPPGRRG